MTLSFNIGKHASPTIARETSFWNFGKIRVARNCIVSVQFDILVRCRFRIYFDVLQFLLSNTRRKVLVSICSMRSGVSRRSLMKLIQKSLIISNDLKIKRPFFCTFSQLKRCLISIWEEITSLWIWDTTDTLNSFFSQRYVESSPISELSKLVT